MKAIDIISYWEELKKLIEKENVYADCEIDKIDVFIKSVAREELK